MPQNIYHTVGKMESKADRKFQNFNMKRILTETTILDPRFKKKGFNSITSCQQAYQKLILNVTSITSNQILQTSNDDVLMLP